jgi:hypothetical protein
MYVKEAKEIARQWVYEEASQSSDFYGAYFAGSTNWMADDAPMPPTSDVDVKIVVNNSELPRSYVKAVFKGILIEASYISSNSFQSPETVLGTYHAARHFTAPNIILDPTGQLTKIQEMVARDFAKREWVTKRCQHALEWLKTRLAWDTSNDPWPQQIFWWLYPILIVPHIVLVADLQNPTVGRALTASRAVLEKYGHLSLHESLLNLIGSADFSQAQVEAHLAALTQLFDVAKTFVKTPFFGSTNINDDARAIVLNDRSLRDGTYREEMYWLTAHVSWCQYVLYNDAPQEVQRKFAPMYQRLLSDLGIHTFSDLQQRNEKLHAMLPRVWEVAEDIMARNPKIRP